MQDLKRKSDKADVEPDPTRRSPSDRDMIKSNMADLSGSGIGGDLGNGNGKEWLMSEIKLMEDNYKNACERRAKIMRFHAEVLERNLHHIYPRAPGFMVLGYQSACQEWDRRRRNVAAYTSRAAEVYVEPVKPASPVKITVKAELEHQTKGAPTSFNPNLSNQPQSSHQEAKAPTTSSTLTGSTTIPPPTSKSPSRPSDAVQKGLLPSVEIIPQAQAQSGSQPTYDPPHTNLDSINVFPGNNDNDLVTNTNGGRAMEIDIDLTMDSSDLPTLDPGEMALFDFINSVANSPTAFETVAPSTAGGMTNTEVNAVTGMDPGLAGMASGSGQEAGAGLDFGLLEAGLQNEITRTGQDAAEGVPKDGPAGTEVQPGLTEGSTSALNPEPLAPQAKDDPNGTNVDPLDLFSKYPDLFNFQGPQDYTSSFDGNNNNNSNDNNDNNANGMDTSNNADAANGNPNGVFDPDSFDYSMLDPNAFFADGMQGMDGM